MKTIYYFLFLSIFALLSCSNNNTKGEIAADEIHEKTIENKYVKITYNSVVFKKDDVPISIINDTVDNFIKLEIKEFRESIDKDIKELIDSGETSGKYELNIITEHYITTYGFISVIIEMNHYTLGAHGNSTFKSINYDVINKKFINLTELGHFEKKEELERFNSLLEKYFIDKDSCFSDKPKIDKDFNTFTIQEDSISVYFAPYELGAYACGTAEILIPISELP